MLWDGHPARSLSLAGKMPAPQNILGYFFYWKSLILAFKSLSICKPQFSPLQVTRSAQAMRAPVATSRETRPMR